MASRDMIGKRGEAIVCAALTDFGSRSLPYFDPHPLGEKCATFDYLVELLGSPIPAYFLVQVKATRRGYTNDRKRLKTGVGRADVGKMMRCPIPTYLIGVDEPTGTTFIVSVHGTRPRPIASLPTRYPLDETNRGVLWAEVRDYWVGLRATKTSALAL